MNILKLAVFFSCFLMQPSGVLADTKPVDKNLAIRAKPVSAIPTKMAKVEPAKKNAKQPKSPAPKKKPEGLVIGKNVKVGMPLNEAIKLLGIPQSFNVTRGTESKLDSLSIEYANHGIVLHSLNGKRKIEALEILPQFKGSFVEGVKMGVKFTALVEKFGVPQSLDSGLAKYPEQGMYFSLKDNLLVAAHVFAKGSKILSHQLYKNR